MVHSHFDSIDAVGITVFLLFLLYLLYRGFKFIFGGQKDRGLTLYQSNVSWQAYEDAENLENRLKRQALEKYALDAMIKLGYLKSGNETEDERSDARRRFTRDYFGVEDRDCALDIFNEFFRQGELPAEEIPLRYKTPSEQKGA